MVEQTDMDKRVVLMPPGSYKRHVQCSGPDESDGSFQEKEDTGHNVFEDNLEYLRSLDPRDWKNQDHYAVLGIKHLRYKAKENTIKKAYRAKVLKHHPDKRKAKGEEVRQDDDYFTCITRAWETLGDKDKRRSYDSVDPFFSDEIPPNNEDSRTNFFKRFGPVFEKNSRWTDKTPVPQLGGPDEPRANVERFYSFWYSFESWREYSYLDEDEKDKAQDRDERRYIDKQNKAARAKLKKEEMSRIRQLVDIAYECDPRIARIKNDDKERKLAFKRAKQEAAKAKQEEEEKAIKEKNEKEKREKETFEAEEKAKQDALKQERDAIKRQMKQKRKQVRDLCKANNYYTQNDSETVHHMTSVEKICETYELKELTAFLESLQLSGREALETSIDSMERKLAIERSAHLTNNSSGKVDNNSKSKKKAADWCSADLQLLIKAVNLFPAGTNQRWEVVANFINQHNSNGVQHTAKDVLAKAKDLQNDDFSRNVLKESANKKAFDNFEKEKKVAKSLEAVGDVSHSERYDSPAEQQGLATWTTAEQQLLEQALRTYGASTPDRWDKISDCIPGRSKRDCMKRYKELAEMVKAKKAAQAGINK